MASVYCCVGMYFLFVVILCAVSLAASIIVMYVHSRSGGIEATLAMPTWVCLQSKFSIHIVYRFRRGINSLSVVLLCRNNFRFTAITVSFQRM